MAIVRSGLDQISKIYDQITNYIYLYHTDTLIILPAFPQSIVDQQSASFPSTNVLGRSAPIFTYTGTGARTISFQFKLHRDMLQQVNLESNFYTKPDGMSAGVAGYNEDYVDLMVKAIQAANLPNYAASQKLIDPPMAAVRIADEVYIKGVVTSCSVGYSGPLLRDKNDPNKYGHYAEIAINFSISETEPYDAETVASIGSMRTSNDIQIRTGLAQRSYDASGNIVSSPGTFGVTDKWQWSTDRFNTTPTR